MVGKPLVFHSQFLCVCLLVVVDVPHRACQQHSPPTSEYEWVCQSVLGNACMCVCVAREERQEKCMTVTKPHCASLSWLFI